MEEELKEFYIENDTTQDQVVTVYKEFPCSEFNLTGDPQTIPAGERVQLVFPKDGTYEVYVDDVSVGYAKYYNDTFKGAIDYTKAALCSDYDCSPGNDCTGEKANFLTKALTKWSYYIGSKSPKYDSVYTEATTRLKCAAIDEWALGLEIEQLTGLNPGYSVTEVTLALVFLEMYKVDEASTDPADYATLKQLYDYTAMNACIKKLGIKECPPAVLPGVENVVSLSVQPTIKELGLPTDLVVQYQFTANDDSYIAVVDSNIPGVDTSKMNGGLYTSTIVGTTDTEELYITYTYNRGGQTLQKTKKVKSNAYAPQWYGGETDVADILDNSGNATVAGIDNTFNNILHVVQSSASGTSANSNTSNKYIYWVTKAPIKFFIGNFEVQSGPWSDTCDPNSYAIITKQAVVTMADGVTQRQMYVYRTCPLQNLPGQVLEYTLIQA